MKRGNAITPDIRLNQLINQRPFSISPVVNFRQKLMKHYIPKIDLVKKSKNFKGKKNKIKSLNVEILPRNVASLSSSPHKINIGLECSHSFDLTKNSAAKRFKPHLTYYKLNQKLGSVSPNRSNSGGKFKLIVKGSQLIN